MRDLRPLDVLDKYHENKIDRATAINHFQLFIESSDIEVLRLDALDFLGEMTPLPKELYPFLEDLLVSDSIEEMRAIAARLIINNFLERGKTAIEHVCQNPCTFILVKYILETLKAVDLDFYTKLRALFINKYARSYEVFPNEAEFFLDFDFEKYKQYGDFELDPNMKKCSCKSVFRLKSYSGSGSDIFYSVHNFHVTGLDFSIWGINTLPSSILKLKRLKYLNLSSNNITELPDLLANLPKLRELYLKENKLNLIPKWIYTLAKKRYFQRYQREGVNQPDAAVLGVFEILTAPLIKYTNINEEVDGWAPHGYTIDDIGHVNALYLSYEVKMTSLPEEIVKLTYLEELYLSGLKIENLSVRVKKFLANLKGFESYNAHEKNLSLINLRKYKYLKL